jgi:hypothetical protein
METNSDLKLIKAQRAVPIESKCFPAIYKSIYYESRYHPEEQTHHKVVGEKTNSEVNANSRDEVVKRVLEIKRHAKVPSRNRLSAANIAVESVKITFS